MSDLIDRQAAIDAVLRAEALVRAYGYRYAADAVRELPSAQPERKKGKWIVHFNDLFPAESTEECSICHAEQLINGNDDNFCPNCGADMRGEGAKEEVDDDNSK